MKAWSIHIRDWPEDIEVIKDGFHWGAFLVPPLWALGSGLWLVAAGLVVVDVLFAVMLMVLDLAPLGGLAVVAGYHVLAGMLAGDLKRWTLRRRGYEEEEVVLAGSADEAALRYCLLNEGR